MVGTIYLICLDEAIGNPDARGGTARHYIGWTNGVTVDRRLEEHRSGRGAAMLAYAAGEGIGFDVVATWEGHRGLERQMKCNGNFARRCPRCRKEVKARDNARRRRRYAELRASGSSPKEARRLS
jgi:hypothetical protein